MKRTWPSVGSCAKANKLSGTCKNFFAGVNKLKVHASYYVTPKSNVTPTLYLGIPVR
jgi:hypothetical protein